MKYYDALRVIRHLPNCHFKYNSYLEMFNDADVETKSFLATHIETWKFQRMLELMDMTDYTLPLIIPVENCSSIGEYYRCGVIFIATDVYSRRPLPFIRNPFWQALIHEMQHHKQCLDGRIGQDNEGFTWRGQSFCTFADLVIMSKEEYCNLPWEKEANLVASRIQDKMISEGLIIQTCFQEQTIEAYYEEHTRTLTRGKSRPTEESYSISELQ